MPRSLFTARAIAGATSAVCLCFPRPMASFRVLIPYPGQRRWKGCRCLLTPVPRSKTQKSDTCSARVNKCPCKAKGWECDPTVCECDNLAFLENPKTCALLVLGCLGRILMVQIRRAYRESEIACPEAQWRILLPKFRHTTWSRGRSYFFADSEVRYLTVV